MFSVLVSKLFSTLLDLLLWMGFKLIHHNTYLRRLGFFVLFNKNSRRLIAYYLDMACQQLEKKKEGNSQFSFE